MSETMKIALTDIKENPDALRVVNKENPAFLELCKSVRKVGVLQPIIVRKAEGENKYILIDGAHRFTAAKEEGLSEIKAEVYTASDMESYELQMITNLHQIKTRAAEYASALRRMLVRDPLLTGPKLCASLGKSEAWLEGMLRLTKLSKEHQGLVNEGLLTLTNAQSLAQLPAEERDAWLDRALTLPPDQFKPAVDNRMKEIRKAKAEGRDPSEASQAFEPQPRARRVAELKVLVDDPATLSGIISGCQTAIEGARAVALYAIKMDPASIEAAKIAYEQRKAEHASASEANKAKRKQEQIAKARKRLAELTGEGSTDDGDDE